MSKQTVLLKVGIPEGWDAGDRVQVYTDFGTGSVDLTKPLLARAFDVFPREHPARSYGRQPYGRGRLGDGKAPRRTTGIGRTIHGKTPYGTAPPLVKIPVQVPAAFGTWKFAVRVVDQAGNPQSAALEVITAVVSGTEPPPLASFTFDSYDAETDQVIFAFTRSVD